MDGLKKGMEINMDGMEVGMGSRIEDMEANIDQKMKDNMENLKNYLKEDMEGLKEGLTKFLQETIPNGEKVVQETHDEKKINVNHDFINSIVGLKTHHIPKLDMRKFDGKDPITWILHMEKYFDLHNVKNTQKVQIATLYLEPNQFIWFGWL